MTLWRRAPREVYRVYGEDEYLADDDGPAAEERYANSVPGQRDDRHPSMTAARSHGSRPGRLVGLGLLVGVTAGALALVVLNASHRSRAVPPGAAQSATDGTASHASSASHPSAFHHTSSAISAGSEPGIRSPSKPISYARPSARPHVRPLARRTERPPEFAPNAVPVKLWRAQVSTSELPKSGASASPIDGEFGFER
jgi:hypothetical protein